MRQVRLADGRTLDAPDWMHDELIDQGVQKFLKDDEARNGAERQLRAQELEYQKQKDELDRVEGQRTREQDVQIGMAKVQGLSALAGGMMQLSQQLSGVTEGLARVSMLEQRFAEVIEALAMLTKVVAVSSQEIKSALLTPKRVLTSNTGKVTGIEPDIEERIN